MRPAERSRAHRELVPSAERPTNLPAGERPLTATLLERRATERFSSEPVSDEHLRAILELALQAPSGFNLQPWRFVVLREVESRERLADLVPERRGLVEAPVVVVALGVKSELDTLVTSVAREAAHRGIGRSEHVAARAHNALDVLATVPSDVWANRHTMVAFTVLMIAAEAYGFDTMPCECFDQRGLRAELDVPDDLEVVALLAIGRRAPGPDKPYPGRFPLERVVFAERYGAPFAAAAQPPARNADVETRGE